MEQTFWETNGDWISAGITMLVAVAIAVAIDRFAFGRAERVADTKDTGELSRETRTRLRLIRRLIFVAIIVIGIALALSQFASIKRFATGILASTAVLGLIIGFAARTVIANFVAGVLMAIRQPIRIGDLISIGEDVHGRVVDIALTYTSVDGGDGNLLVIPNEKVINDVVVNHSSGNRKAPATVELTVPIDVDIDAARQALEGTDITAIRMTKVDQDGARLQVKAPIDGRDREAREAEVRELVQRALRGAGVLHAP
jgi:small-conductance mechanosensitive channel